MKITLCGHDRLYDIQGVCQLFFPGTSFTDEDGRTLVSSFSKDGAFASYRSDGTEYVSSMSLSDGFDSERIAIKRSVYDVFCRATGITSPWGLLTGIKPAVYYDSLKKRFGEAADGIFSNDYSVLPEKLRLVKKVSDVRKRALSLLSPKKISLYVSIPFCPSRCRYCSFVSSSTEKEGKYVEPYLQALAKEAEYKGRLIREAGYTVSTVYIGGGTPGILTPVQEKYLLDALFGSFDLSGIEEFTYEAGRPDTVTEEKLRVLMSYGIGRVSINPQTLSDYVLEYVGRRHTAADFFKAYEIADRLGFSVNTDTIAGLPTDTQESFENTYRDLVSLCPDNITLHSLYIKRASDMQISPSSDIKRISENTGRMVGYAETLCEKSGYVPYYLYRQKSTVGNHENVGYAKPGRECLYNIFMMDDVQTVIGLGANGMTKFVLSSGDTERICNTKFAYNYITDTSSDKDKFNNVFFKVQNL